MAGAMPLDQEGKKNLAKVIACNNQHNPLVAWRTATHVQARVCSKGIEL
jgi:hypothetical protein